ncbi:MAG: acetyl-CoA carboxylase biotin carboxyl carrier protein [Candidatus Omnitrophica bacterium]|nr:acetyl-CoA carboxylase biotin carboxyl carrier protein [Candidatus Omnitrophota bacterium]
MNKKIIEEILELMEKYSLTEMDLEEENLKVHFKKGHDIANFAHASAPIVQLPQMASNPAVSDTKETVPSNLIEVKAPMVGTFYSAPAPDADPYVSVGSQIKQGDVLCILEAMKLMNEIKSEVKGKIAKIVVENAQPVEFGQVLFLVDPS